MSLSSDTFSPRRWKSRLQPNLAIETFILCSPYLFSISLLLDENGGWWNLKADILDPRTGIARPLTGVSIGGQAPDQVKDVIDVEQGGNYDAGVDDKHSHNDDNNDK